MSNERFHNLITGLFGAFGRNIKPNAIAMWAAALGDLEFQQVESAIGRAIRECEEFPSPARVRNFAKGASETDAQSAWTIAVSAVGHVGYMKSVCFQDATINATIRNMGGWPSFCGQFEREAEVWVRKTFIETYLRLLGRITEEMGAPLQGAGEHVRRLNIACNGYNVISPVTAFLAQSEQPKLTSEMEERRAANNEPRPQWKSDRESEKETQERCQQAREEIGEVELRRRKDNFLKELEENEKRKTRN